MIISVSSTLKPVDRYGTTCLHCFDNSLFQWAGSDPDDDEWIIEITEFPVLLLDLKTLKVTHCTVMLSY